MKLANVKNQEYTKEMFKDIAFFTLAEPTSNHDSLNEAVILIVLRDEGAGRTVAVVWVCHVVYFVFGVKTIREEE